MSTFSLPRNLWAVQHYLVWFRVDEVASHGFWDPEETVFTRKALPYIGCIPIAAGFLIIICLILQRLLPRTPLWARNFIREAEVESRDGSDGKQWSGSSIFPLLASLAGLVSSGAVFGHRQDGTTLFLALSWLTLVSLWLILRPQRFSISTLIMFSCIFASQFVLLFMTRRVLVLAWTDLTETFALAMAAYGTAHSLAMPIRPKNLPRDHLPKPSNPPNPQLRSPEDDLTAWQYMTVSWLKPLLKLGAKRQLDEEDVWSLGYEFHHRRLHDAFRGLRGTVLRRLCVANALDLMITSALGIFETLCQVTGPVLLQKLLQSIQNPDAPPRAAFTYALVALLLRLIQNQSSVFNMWYGRRCYERSRGEMITMLYEKTLSRKLAGGDPQQPTLPNDAQVSPAHGSKGFQRFIPNWMNTRKRTSGVVKATKPAAMGKILNLMRNDAYEVAQRFWDFKKFITAPFEVLVSIAILWNLIGWSCLFGVVTILIAQALNVLLARALVTWEKKRRAATDERVQSISQFIEGIRHLRWYGWQEAWLKQIIGYRQQELRLMIATRVYQLAIATVNLLASLMFPVVAFWAYCYLLRQPLTVDVAFPAIALFQVLEGSMRTLPDLITTFLNAAVAMNRIEAFMDEEDKPEYTSSTTDKLRLDGATFAWPRSGKIVLEDVSLRLPVGTTVVGGVVGAGKTALLLALLGELDLVGGACSHSGDAIGYCEQRPWLQSMSIRDNILFYSGYDAVRYEQVLDACCLNPDLASFPQRDLSHIGENGVGLSGGQRARVALARAIYSNSKVLLLDDPLSSLDQQTAESVVKKCLSGPLVEGRIVILVTHRLDLCRDIATQYIEVSHGAAHVKTISDIPYFFNPAPTGNTEGETPTDSEWLEDEREVKFMEDEHREHGAIQMSVYWEYIKAGQIRWWVTLIVIFTVMRTFSAFRIWFLKTWAEAYDTRVHMSLGGLQDQFPDPTRDVAPWLFAFFILSLSYWMLVSLGRGIMAAIVYFAGRQMFKDVVERVAYAPFRFYDVTPIGRLMNRMTSDIGTIDGDISRVFQEMGFLTVVWVYSLAIVAAITPAFLLFAIITTIGFVYTFSCFLPASQSLRRLEMTSLSPLLSDFGDLVDGLRTVRAFRMQSRFQDRVIAETDNFQRMDHFFWSSQTWLAYRLDNISALSTFCLTLIGLSTGVSAGLLAFALNAADHFVQATPQICQIYGKLQMDFVSVERVVELIRLDREPPGDMLPPAAWPTSHGSIVFDNVTIRYAPHMEPALSGVSFSVIGGSTTAITGRTGSGKSTLAAALLVAVTPESGTILIDGVDIARVDKQALRSRITFVAQDPLLFSGTIRENLDPLSAHSIEDCDRVLQKVCSEGRYGWTLATRVDAGGRNFSQGQRQLIGLARAILRRSAIVILDEATASIDITTSKLIQNILREEMQNSTVLTIAHRVEAVQGADSSLELDQGRLSKYSLVNATA